MLACGDFVMRRLDVESHLLERQHDLAPDVLTQIDGREVEVAAGVVRFGRRLAVPRRWKRKNSASGPALAAKSLSAASAIARFSVDRGHPANGVPSGVSMSQIIRADLLARPVAPGKDQEGAQVGLEVHVRFLDPDESLDRGAVEHDFAVERVFELAIGDFDVLDRAEDVGELQAHELHLFALGPLEDAGLLLGQVARGFLRSHSWCSCRGVRFSRISSRPRFPGGSGGISCRRARRMGSQCSI